MRLPETPRNGPDLFQKNQKKMSDYTAEEKAIAIAPKFTSLLSMAGSAFIILHQFSTARADRRGGGNNHDRRRRDRRNHNKAASNTHYRLLVGMSVCDFFVSLGFFFTTWPIPSWEDAYGAAGNQTTCNVQGWLSHFSLAVVVYNASLSTYYLLRIRYEWTAREIERRAEPLLHAAPFAVGVGTSTAALRLGLYNNDSWECWIAPYPRDCDEQYKNRNGGDVTIPCVRGENASLYRWVLWYAICPVAILYVTVNMFLVYRSVYRKEKDSARHDFAGGCSDGRRAAAAPAGSTGTSSSAARERFRYSKKVAIRGYWYCGAFYATWAFPTINSMVRLAVPIVPSWLLILTSMFVPIQGFFNCIVYVHPRREEIKRGWNEWCGRTAELVSNSAFFVLSGGRSSSGAGAFRPSSGGPSSASSLHLASVQIHDVENSPGTFEMSTDGGVSVHSDLSLESGNCEGDEHDDEEEKQEEQEAEYTDREETVEASRRHDMNITGDAHCIVTHANAAQDEEEKAEEADNDECDVRTSGRGYREKSNGMDSSNGPARSQASLSSSSRSVKGREDAPA